MKPPRPFLAALSLAVAGCAATPPQAGGGKPGGMKEMCKHHAAARPAGTASAPDGMMDRHCRASATGPAAAASHAH